MRLTCPNCSAEYEVDASVIPEDGRDVQCSNCSTTWFQEPASAGGRAIALESPAPDKSPSMPPVRRPDEVVEAEVLDASASGDRAALKPEQDHKSRRSRVAREQANRPAPGPETPLLNPLDPEDDDTGVLPPPPDRPRRKIDDEVLEVLRSEADREDRMRRGERVDPIESQPELDLTGIAPRQTRRVPTDPKEIPDDDLVPSGTIGRRKSREAGREVLPDIEEINSSLRSTSERPGSVAAFMEVEETLKKVRRGQGFRLGFSAMLVLLVFVLLPYIFATEIVARWPQAEPMLDGYVDLINRLRLQLDGVMRNLTERLSALITDNSG